MSMDVIRDLACEESSPHSPCNCNKAALRGFFRNQGYMGA